MAEEIAKVAETEKATDAAVDVKALMDQLEATKRTQSGSDKAYQESAARARELESELEKLKKEKMTEKEVATFELAKERAAVEQSKREVADATLRLTKMQLLGSKNVSAEFSDFISGKSEKELTANLDTFTKLFDAEVGKRVNEKLAGSPAPKAGADQVKNPELAKLSFKEMNTLAALGKLKL